MAFRLGLTGTIGCGKSTVAGMIGELARRLLPEPAIEIIDADQLAREAVEPGQPTLDEIVETFGPSVLDDQGRLDRAALARLVFKDRTAVAHLNAIVHPYVREAELELMRQWSDRAMLVLDVPLLYEAGMESLVERVMVVTISERARFGRLRERGLTEAQVMARLGMQWPQSRKARMADTVIDNSGSLDATRAQLENSFRQWSREGLIPPLRD